MFPAVQSTAFASPKGSDALSARAPKAPSDAVEIERAARVEITREARERAMRMGDAKVTSAEATSDDPTFKPILWSDALWAHNPSGIGHRDTAGTPVSAEIPAAPVELSPLSQEAEAPDQDLPTLGQRLGATEGDPAADPTEAEPEASAIRTEGGEDAVPTMGREGDGEAAAMTRGKGLDGRITARFAAFAHDRWSGPAFRVRA